MVDRVEDQDERGRKAGDRAADEVDFWAKAREDDSKVIEMWEDEPAREDARSLRLPPAAEPPILSPDSAPARSPDDIAATLARMTAPEAIAPAAAVAGAALAAKAAGSAAAPTVSPAAAAPAGEASSKPADKPRAVPSSVRQSVAHRLVFLHLLMTALVAGAIAAPSVVPQVLEGAGIELRKAPLLTLCALVGVLGALFSAVLRAARADQGVRPGWGVMVVAALVSAVLGGLLMHLLVAAGLLEGGVFPRFECVGEGRCGTLPDLVRNLTPVAPTDYAKTALCAFAAGFLERLSPIGFNRRTAADATPSP